MTAMEAAWGLLEKPITGLSHAVVHLTVHLENQENVYFQKDQAERKRRQLLLGRPTSQLTAFFDLCKHDPEARQFTYLEIPKHYRYNKSQICWVKRIQNREARTIPRIYTVRPKFRELFALRLLLQTIKGPQCFADLKRREDRTLCETFQQAARERKLMNDEDEWRNAMREAATYAMPPEMRRLFATILLYTDVKNPEGIWKDFEDQLLDRKGRTVEEKRARALFHVNSILKANGTDLKTERLFEHVDISNISDADNDGLEGDITAAEASKMATKMQAQMNLEQKKAFKTLMKAATSKTQKRCFFLQGKHQKRKQLRLRCWWLRQDIRL